MIEWPIMPPILHFICSQEHTTIDGGLSQVNLRKLAHQLCNSAHMFDTHVCGAVEFTPRALINPPPPTPTAHPPHPPPPHPTPTPTSTTTPPTTSSDKMDKTICNLISKNHLSLFLGVQLTIITPNRFRKWLGTEYATSHYLNQCWPDSYMRIYAALGWDELLMT